MVFTTAQKLSTPEVGMVQTSAKHVFVTELWKSLETLNTALQLPSCFKRDNMRDNFLRLVELWLRKFKSAVSLEMNKFYIYTHKTDSTSM